MPTSSADVLRGFAPRLDPELIARAEAWAAGSDSGSEAVPARPAASVVLLREAPELETYLLHRHARMAFAASMVVFPGGRMDPADRSAADPWRACAVRETTEETGVVLAPEELLAWAAWTTPAFEPRRYETRFYVAALPAGQEAADVSGETDSAEWTAPAEALAAAARGELALMPPTQSILLELVELGSLAAVRAAAEDRRIVPVLPELVRGPEGWRFHYPADTPR